MKALKFAAVLLVAVGMFSATAVALPGDDCATAVPAPGSLDPCLDTNPTGPFSSPVQCGGVGGLGGGTVLDVWVSFVATATEHRVTTDPSPSGTDSTFAVWDACGGNVIGCAEDITYNAPPNYLGDTCVGGLTIGQTYYVQLGGWSAGGSAIPGYMGSCGVYDVTIGAATGTTCGDGTVSCIPGAEQCDDGNATDGDGCDSNCTPTGCGNGILTSGETCDDGNQNDGDGCDSNCTATGCGNGIVTAGEDCDDGNLTDGDGCSSECLFEGEPPVPAVSEWGLLVLVLIGLTAGTVIFGRKQVVA